MPVDDEHLLQFWICVPVTVEDDLADAVLLAFLARDRDIVPPRLRQVDLLAGPVPRLLPDDLVVSPAVGPLEQGYD